MKLKLQPLLLALTLANAGMMGWMITHSSTASAAPNDDGILRGRGLQITDNYGKVRASISIMPAEKLKDGSTYPETVLLRLITEEGRPTVKLSAMTDGAGMSLGDGKGLSYIQALARGDKPEVNIVDKTGKKATALP